MSIKLRVLPVIFLFISACGSGLDGASFTQSLNSSVDNPDVIFNNEVCYKSGVDSCHGLTQVANLTMPADYDYPNNNNPQYRKPDHFIDLATEGSNKLVSTNFNRDDFLSLAKGRYGILSPLLIERVQNIRDAIGQPIKVNSGFRNPTYNESVGGAEFSRHMYGDAIDFKSTSMTPSQLKAHCEEQGASHIQVYVGHIHCDWRNEPLPIEFYSEQGPPINTAQKNKLKKVTHDNFLTTVNIGHSGTIKAGNTIDVFVTSEGAEEGAGELLREWKIRKDGEIIQRNNQVQIQLQLEQGIYYIEVQLGGYWTKTKSITVE